MQFTSRITLILMAMCGLAAAASKPNVLVILADDMGFSDIGCYGGEIATPNIDKLAAGGVRFTQFYNTARCWPTRTALMSGYYPQQLRADPPRGPHPAWARLAPHYLKPAGYRTYHSGKWHLPGAPRVCADGGFDHSYKIDDHDRFFNPKNHTEDDQKLPAIQPDSGFYITTHIANHAIKCLKEHQEKHADKPFFSYLAFIAPHFPLHALQEDIERYKGAYDVGWDAIRERRLARQREMGIVNTGLSDRSNVIPTWNLKEAELQKRISAGEAGFAVAWTALSDEQRKFQAQKMAIHAAMVDRMDREIGRVLEQVRAMGAMDNTLILFASDNGASAEQLIRGDGHDPKLAPGSAGTFLCLGPGWSTAANTPMRLHKSFVHEGGISTPLIAHWPAGIAARGELRRDIGHVVDIVPTMLELAGVTWTEDWNGAKAPALVGRSLVAAFAKDGAVRREQVFFHHDTNRALRMGDWKIVRLKGSEEWELYDLGTDRIEKNNLAAQHPQRVQDMSAVWEKLEAQFRAEAGPAPETPARRPATRAK